MQVFGFIDEGLGHSSYVIDLGDGTAAVVDPPRFPTAHDALIERLHLRLAGTLDSHSHADYVTGSPALAERTGATFVAPIASHLESPHRPVTDNEHVALAESVELVAVATPGHTPDHHAYVVAEHGAPVALFSGGSLRRQAERDAFDRDAAFAALRNARVDDIEGYVDVLRKVANQSLGMDDEG